MARKTIITGDDSLDDFEEPRRQFPGGVDSFSNVPSDEDALLRPTRMFDMVGQRAVYERIEIAVQAAQKRGEPLGHILFDGPPLCPYLDILHPHDRPADGHCPVWHCKQQDPLK